MWNLLSFGRSEKKEESKGGGGEEELLIMSGGTMGPSATSLNDRIKESLKNSKKEEVKVAQIFLMKKEKMLKEFPDLRVEPADRLEVPESFEMATIRGAIELLENFRDNKLKAESEGGAAAKKQKGEAKQSGGAGAGGGSKKAEAEALASTQQTEAKKIVAPIIEQNKALREEREVLEISNQELRGKVGFLSKQVEEYERETQVLSAKNGHLEKQLMAFEQKEKETLKMTTQEVRLYERKNLNLLRENRHLKQEIERLLAEIKELQLKHLAKAKNKIDQEVKDEQPAPKLEETQVLKIERSPVPPQLVNEEATSLLGRFMKADRKRLFGIFAEFLDIPELMSLRLMNREMNLLFQVSPRIWLPVMKIRIENKIKAMRNVVHHSWTSDPKLKEIMTLFLGGKYKTGGHFEQCIYETQKFISEKLGYLRRRFEENSMGAELPDILPPAAAPEKRRTTGTSFMNTFKDIFKKKKKNNETPTPLMPRKIKQELESAKEEERKSTEETGDTSSEGSKESRLLRPRTTNSARSSFLSAASGEEFDMLEFRSVPDIMGYLESIEGMLNDKTEVAEWLRDLRKYYANLLVYSKYCLFDIKRLEKVKNVLKSKVEEVELVNIDLKESRDEYKLRLEAHQKVGSAQPAKS